MHSRYKELMAEIKERFNQETSYKEKLKILTLSPYSIRETMHYFNTTKYMAEQGHKMKSNHGVLPHLPEYSKGKALTKSQLEVISEFYNRDDISRVCPGWKMTMGIKNENGEIIYTAKRLILGTLRSIYQEYRSEVSQSIEEYTGLSESCPSPAVGFSTFAKLKPKYCVFPGPKGTHTVCVCKYHHNPKLMISSIKVESLDYKMLMKKCVCNDDLESLNCMLQKCQKCPGISGVKLYLENLERLQEKEEIRYHQWIGTDRVEMKECIDTVENFIERLSLDIYNLTRHHIISKIQMNYLKSLKINLSEQELIIIGDFAENYKVITQNEIQSAHWNNIQVTLHPMVLYYKKDDKLKNLSYCFISDHLRHNTISFYHFQKKIIEEIKVKFPSVKKLHYFSDGCAGQYKNKYNFYNLCNHKNDFNLEAEWNFFATSHGKNACDGIGGTLKRVAYHQSLVAENSGFILNASDFYYHVKEKCKSVNCIYVESKDINKTEVSIKHRFDVACTIVGTKSYHRYIPINETQLKSFHTSIDENFIVHNIKFDKVKIHNEIQSKDLALGCYVSCFYKKRCCFGIIEDRSEEFGDYYINFLTLIPNSNNKFKFPSNEEKGWLEPFNILKLLSLPKLIKDNSLIVYNFKKIEISNSYKNAASRVSGKTKQGLK